MSFRIDECCPKNCQAYVSLMTEHDEVRKGQRLVTCEVAKKETASIIRLPQHERAGCSSINQQLLPEAAAILTFVGIRERKINETILPAPKIFRKYFREVLSFRFCTSPTMEAVQARARLETSTCNLLLNETLYTIRFVHRLIF